MILLTVYSLFSSLLAFRYSYPNFADSLPKKGLSRQQLFSRKPCVRKASFGLSAVGVFTRSPSSFSQGLGFSVPAAPAAKSRGCLIRFRIARTSVVRRLAAASAASGYNEVNNERMTYIPLPCQRAWNPARHASCLGAAKVMKRWTSVMRRSKKSPNHLRPKARTLRCARPFPSKRCFSRFNGITSAPAEIIHLFYVNDKSIGKGKRAQGEKSEKFEYRPIPLDRSGGAPCPTAQKQPPSAGLYKAEENSRGVRFNGGQKPKGQIVSLGARVHAE